MKLQILASVLFFGLVAGVLLIPSGSGSGGDTVGTLPLMNTVASI